jgi:hypothetical protein
MKKIIALPLLLLVLNFNAQKDFITKYDLKTFVSNNYELIENFSPEDIRERLKFQKNIPTYLKISGMRTLFNRKDIDLELKEKMSDNKNYINFRNRTLISKGVILTAILGSTAITIKEPYFFLISIIIIYPSALVLAIIPQIGISKIKAQLLKDYLLSISSSNTN